MITGTLGWLGAWTVPNLAKDGVPATVYDLSSSKDRLSLMSSAENDWINLIHADISQAETVIQAVEETAVSHVLHLAALQVPACRSNPA